MRMKVAKLSDRELENIIWLAKEQQQRINTASFQEEIDALALKLITESERRGILDDLLGRWFNGDPKT